MSIFRTPGRTLRRIGIALVATLALTFGSLAVAGPASASADGCTTFGTGLPKAFGNGQYCAGVEGDGTYIRTVHANFGMTVPGVDRLCTPSIKLDVFDRWDHWVTSRQGPQASGCAWGAFNFPPSIPVWWDFPQADGGKLYVTLQSSGTSVAVVRFDFHK